MNRMNQLTPCLLLSLTLAVQTSWVHASDGKAPVGAPQLAQTNAEVQLRAMMAPTNPANKATKKEAPISVILILASKDQGSFVCEMTPRLRDSILEALHSNPIPLSALNVMDLRQTEPLLLEALNKALRSPLLVAVKVKPASEELKIGSNSTRASALGCAEIEEQQKTGR